MLPNNEKDEIRRVRWKCRRGMLELDQLLLGFFDHCYADLSTDERACFNELLTYPDPLLWQWLTGQTKPDLESMQLLVAKITENKNIY